jgi:hypothetical protein
MEGHDPSRDRFSTLIQTLLGLLPTPKIIFTSPGFCNLAHGLSPKFHVPPVFFLHTAKTE